MKWIFPHHWRFANLCKELSSSRSRPKLSVPVTVRVQTGKWKLKYKMARTKYKTRSFKSRFLEHSCHIYPTPRQSLTGSQYPTQPRLFLITRPVPPAGNDRVASNNYFILTEIWRSRGLEMQVTKWQIQLILAEKIIATSLPPPNDFLTEKNIHFLFF